LDTNQLAKNLAQKRPSEHGGTYAGRGFAYQANWILYKLLNLFEEGEDFAVLIEWHDDMIYMDSSTAPTALEFYQVKSTNRKTPRNLKEVLVLKKGSSILGKLCRHVKTFPNDVNKLTLVSNIGFKLKMADGATTDSLSEVHFKDAHADVIKSTSVVLTNELGEDFVESALYITVFLRSTLSLDETERDVKGYLVDFLGRFDAGTSFHVPALYKTLKAEIYKRANRVAQPNDLASLLESKGITRSRFEGDLRTASTSDLPKNKVERACEQLRAEGWSHEQQQRLRGCVTDYELSRMSLEDEQFVQLRQAVANAYERGVTEISRIDKLNDRLVKILELVASNAGGVSRQSDDNLVRVIAIVEYEYA